MFCYSTWGAYKILNETIISRTKYSIESHFCFRFYSQNLDFIKYFIHTLYRIMKIHFCCNMRVSYKIYNKTCFRWNTWGMYKIYKRNMFSHIKYKMKHVSIFIFCSHPLYYNKNTFPLRILYTIIQWNHNYVRRAFLEEKNKFTHPSRAISTEIRTNSNSLIL